MARLPRISPPDIPVHVIQRGNNRQACFVANEDHGAYVGWLKEYSKKYKVEIHAWVMMTNHVHLLCTPRQEGGISRMMQSLGVDMYNISTLNIAVVEHCGKDVLNLV